MLPHKHTSVHYRKDYIVKIFGISKTHVHDVISIRTIEFCDKDVVKKNQV